MWNCIVEEAYSPYPGVRPNSERFIPGLEKVWQDPALRHPTVRCEQIVAKGCNGDVGAVPRDLIRRICWGIDLPMWGDHDNES